MHGSFTLENAKTVALQNGVYTLHTEFLFQCPKILDSILDSVLKALPAASSHSCVMTLYFYILYDILGFLRKNHNHQNLQEGSGAMLQSALHMSVLKPEGIMCGNMSFKLCAQQ